jgi:tetratricopeptide (TPR) repeat protein
LSPQRATLLEPAGRAAVASPPAGVAAAPPDPAIRVAPPPDAPSLFGRANEARRLGDHPSAAHYYRALIEDNPSSSEAHDALAVLGRMLLDDTDAEGALRCFDEYLRVGGPLREDVMLGRALCLQRLGRAGDETRALESLVAAYPHSVHAERARRRLLHLGRP